MAARHHEGVPDLLWSDVRDLFDATERGVLPDVHVPGTGVQDWQDVVEFIRTDLRHEYTEDGQPAQLPDDVDRLLGGGLAPARELRAWLEADIIAIFRFLGPNEVDFDVDLRELQGQGAWTRCAPSSAP